MFLHNYHTHTTRSHHANGTDREYVEAAIQAGFQTLGFSDHAPYVLPIGNSEPQMRIFLEDTEDYVHSIHALAKEYANDIRILCGFELEYYPLFHAEEMAYLHSFPHDYRIMGQHFMNNQIPPIPNSKLRLDKDLTAYVSQVLEGLATGDFLYLAHPDFPGSFCSEQAVQKEYRRLCEGVKRMQIPIEMNLLGIREQRHYPNETFWKIAAEVGNEVVLGADAHTPESLLQTGEDTALEIIQRLGLTLRTQPLL